MNDSINTSQSECWCQEAQAETHSVTRPPASIDEGAPNIVVVSFVTCSKNADRDEEEEQHVESAPQGFPQRQELLPDSGSYGCDTCGSNHHQCCMPTLRVISRVIQHSNTLDHSSDQEGNRRYTANPSSDCDPPLNVADDRTPSEGCVFSSPVILGSCNWRACGKLLVCVSILPPT